MYKFTFKHMFSFFNVFTRRNRVHRNVRIKLFTYSVKCNPLNQEVVYD